MEYNTNESLGRGKGFQSSDLVLAGCARQLESKASAAGSRSLKKHKQITSEAVAFDKNKWAGQPCGEPGRRKTRCSNGTMISTRIYPMCK